MPNSPNPPVRRTLRSSEYGCQFTAHDSPLHRLGAGWKLLIGMALSALAAGARTPGELAGLTALTLAYYLAGRLTLLDLWRDIGLFLFQAGLVLPLYCLSYGFPDGLWPGVRVSTQIILFYIPGAVFLRTTRTSDVMRGLRRVLPYRLSFLVLLSLRFVPFFFRELGDIRAAQRLRGARLSPRELMDPRNWQEVFHCLFLPLMVRALKTADEVARSAEARGFGSGSTRTYFDAASLAPGSPERQSTPGDPP